METDPDFLQQKSSDIMSFCIFSQWDSRSSWERIGGVEVGSDLKAMF